MLPPLGDKNLSFIESGEDFAIQEFIKELAVKGFEVAILPGATRLDEERLDLGAFKPSFHGFSTELWAVIVADVFGCTALKKQLSKCL